MLKCWNYLLLVNLITDLPTCFICANNERGFHEANLASHHTRDRHVGFLSLQSGIRKHNKMSRFQFSSCHNTRLQLNGKNISTQNRRMKFKILVWSESKIVLLFPYNPFTLYGTFFTISVLIFLVFIWIREKKKSQNPILWFCKLKYNFNQTNCQQNILRKYKLHLWKYKIALWLDILYQVT